MSQADRRAFPGPWRSPGSRRAIQGILAGVLRFDPVMAGAAGKFTSSFQE